MWQVKWSCIINVRDLMSLIILTKIAQIWAICPYWFQFRAKMHTWRRNGNTHPKLREKCWFRFWIHWYVHLSSNYAEKHTPNTLIQLIWNWFIFLFSTNINYQNQKTLILKYHGDYMPPFRTIGWKWKTWIPVSFWFKLKSSFCYGFSVGCKN